MNLSNLVRSPYLIGKVGYLIPLVFGAVLLVALGANAGISLVTSIEVHVEVYWFAFLLSVTFGFFASLYAMKKTQGFFTGILRGELVSKGVDRLLSEYDEEANRMHSPPLEAVWPLLAVADLAIMLIVLPIAALLTDVLPVFSAWSFLSPYPMLVFVSLTAVLVLHPDWDVPLPMAIFACTAAAAFWLFPFLNPTFFVNRLLTTGYVCLAGVSECGSAIHSRLPF